MVVFKVVGLGVVGLGVVVGLQNLQLFLHITLILDLYFALLQYPFFALMAQYLKV